MKRSFSLVALVFGLFFFVGSAYGTNGCGALSPYDHCNLPAANPGQIVNGTCISGFAPYCTRQCQSDGTWSSHFIVRCLTVVPCPNEDYENASWTPTPTGTLNVAGNCLPGYVGAPTRDCPADGTGWATTLGGTPCTPVCAQTCNNGGTCAAPDTCACASGWTGSDCTTPVCTQGCSNGGTCIGPNTCSCSGLWTGSDCTTPICTQGCSNGGTCASPNTCACASGWTGSDCTTPICTIPCNNGGTCSAPETCSCVGGYTGIFCQIPPTVTQCTGDSYAHATWVDTPIGSTAQGICDTGYASSSTSTRLCQVGGVWSNNIHNSCVRLYCSADNSGAVGNAVWTQTAAGRTVFGSCAPTFTRNPATPPPTRTCNDLGTWENTASNPCMPPTQAIN